MAELSPAELDRLEDALEDLEQPGALDALLSDEPSAAIRERLGDYHLLLEASREAMPLQEVPGGLLDDVIAQAHQAAAAPAAAPRESWWVRWRRSFMVPAVALAGTAALVLWIGRPDEQASLADPPPPAATPAKQRAKSVKITFEEPEDQAEQTRPEVAADPAPAPPPARAAAPAEGDGENEIVQPTEIPQLDSLGDVPETEKSKADKDKLAEGAIGNDAKAAGGSAGRWDIISRGDRARQAGDCVTARMEYAVALEDDEARVRARAFAGMGLCDQNSGDSPSADANFERARELDGEIGSFIDSQRQARRPSKSAKKKKRKSKPKSKFSSQVDPFG